MKVVLVSLIENSECQQICLSFGGGHHTLLTLLLLLLIILRKNWQTWNIYRECGIQLKSMKYCEMQSVVSFCACWYDVQAFICSLGSGCNIEFPFEKWIKFDSHKIVDMSQRSGSTRWLVHLPTNSKHYFFLLLFHDIYLVD